MDSCNKRVSQAQDELIISTDNVNVNYFTLAIAWMLKG